MLIRICFMRLKTAGIVVGAFGVLCSIISMAAMIYALANMDELYDWFSHASHQSLNTELMKSSFIAVIVIVLVLGAAHAVASVLLIVGAVKQKHRYVLPWLTFSALTMFMLALYYLYIITMTALMRTEFAFIIIIVVRALFSLAFHAIWWYGMYCLYKEIQTNNKNKQVTEQKGTAYVKF